MIAVRPAASDADLEAWRRVRMAVLPGERARTVEEMRRASTPDSLYLLAELDGRAAGSAVAGRSDRAGQGFLAPRVLPEAPRRGVGAGSLRELADHVQRLGFDRAGTILDDPGRGLHLDPERKRGDAIRDESVGYVTRSVGIRVRGSLPLAR